MVPPEHFGAARMLKDAGVDRFALAERLRQMDAEQVAVLTRRFEQQRAALMARVEEARFCERFLRQNVFSGPLEEAWLARLPLPAETLEPLARGPRGPFVEPADLQRIFRESPLEENRVLAALAGYRMGLGGADAFRVVRKALHDDGPIGLEAALCLADFAMLVPHLRPPLDARDWTRAAARAGEALSRSDLRLPAALVIAIERRLYHRWPNDGRKSTERGPSEDEIAAILNDGLTHPDPRLSLACAMLLFDEARLLSELPAEDPARRNAARQALLERSAHLERVLSSMSAEPEEQRRSWLRHVPLPLSAGPLTTVLVEADRGDARHTTEVLRWLRQIPAADYPPDSLGALAGWLNAGRAARLAAGDLLDLLAWMATPARDPERPWIRPLPLRSGPAETLRERVAEALLRLPEEDLGHLIASHSEGLTAWLWGESGSRLDEVLDRFAAHPSAARSLFQFLCAMECRLEPEAGLPPRRNWQLLMGIWERRPADSRPALAAAVAAGWSFSYAQDEEGARKALRDRYRERPEERACLKVAFSGLLNRSGTDWRAFHEEVAPGEARGGPDLLRALSELCQAAPGDIYHHVDWLLADLKPEGTPAFCERLFAQLVAQEDTATQMLPPAVALARWLDENRSMFGDPALRQAVLSVFRRGWQAVLERCRPTTDGSVEYYRQEKEQEISEILSRLEETGVRSPTP
jgi:hypothetical protein